MRAEIIAIGNEIITGHVVNTNAAYIASAIQNIGIMPMYHTAICDEVEAIKGALSTALKRVEAVFITGGLGPTRDDLTKEAICDYLEMKLEIWPDLLDELKAYFERLQKPMAVINKKQVAFPKSAYILKNPNGTAPGCILEKEGKYIILMPGPPKEMQPMLNNEVISYFKKKMKTYYETIDVKLFGIGESDVATQIAHLLGNFEWGSVATYVGKYEVIVRITVQAQTQMAARTQAQKIEDQVCQCLEPYIIGYNEDELEELVKQELKKNNMTVATVESCTGGLLAGALVNISGISQCFNEGIVTYSNAAKRKYVEVQEETLKQYGAVSKQTAREMAEGVKKVSGASIGLSTTGVAGPDGGTRDKPVGLVYIGIALPDKTYVYELRLNGTRQDVRAKTVKNILFKLYQLLK